MRCNLLLRPVLISIFFLFNLGFNSPSSQVEKLVEGNNGIASKYPGDKNIEQDPNVIFADDFENSSTVDDLLKKWEVLINKEHISIQEGVGNITGGSKSLQLRIPKQDVSLSTGISKLLSNTQDILFLRWYMKFDKEWYVPGESVHNGGSISSKYFDQGKATPGIPANGINKYLVNFENENSVGETPGNMNVYVYWPEQGDIWGDHFFPSGKILPYSHSRSCENTFGDRFESLPDFSPQTNRWYCYEYMVKANTPGKRDGRIAMWIDGKLIADFPNLRLRDTDDLKIDRFGLDLYIAKNSARENVKWHDNVVAATSYIGPVVNEPSGK